MYYAMKFVPTPWNTFTVRTVRAAPYNSLEQAIKALIRSKHEGYVTNPGFSKPLWSNVK